MAREPKGVVAMTHLDRGASWAFPRHAERQDAEAAWHRRSAERPDALRGTLTGALALACSLALACALSLVAVPAWAAEGAVPRGLGGSVVGILLDNSDSTQEGSYLSILIETGADDVQPDGMVKVEFDPGEGVFEGCAVGESVSVLAVKGSCVPAWQAPVPKRAGYQLKGWYHVVDGQERDWAFASGAGDLAASRVKAPTVLHARWEARLDVTVPVEVGFAIATDGTDAIAPKAGAYRVKSRTAAPVAVTGLETVTLADEAEAFFRFKDGRSPSAQDWRSALSKVRFALWRTDGAGNAQGGTRVEIPLASASGNAAYDAGVTDADGNDANGWIGVPATGIPSAFSLAAFEGYGSGDAYAEEWWRDPALESVQLPLGLDIDLADAGLEPNVGDDDLNVPKPLTRLKVTVAIEQ